MKARSFFILMLFLLLFTGCGEQHQSKVLVRNFLNKNLVYSDISEDRYSDMDSTTHVTKDRIEKMHEITGKMPEFRHGIQYGVPTSTLMYMTVSYKITRNNGKAKHFQQTFYMDRNLTGIVAFKNN